VSSSPEVPDSAPDDFPQLIVPREAPADEAPPEWSPRARLLLIGAAVIGVLLAVYGVALLFEPLRLLSVLDIFKPVIGVALVALGGLLGGQSIRLLTTAGPEKPYRPGDPKQSRALFVLVWLVGSSASLALSLDSVASLKPGLIAAAVIGVVVAGASAWWLTRWIAAKIESQWPAFDTANVVHRRTSAWSVFFAFVWGIFSSALAVLVELFLLGLALPYIQSQAGLEFTPEIMLTELLANPVIIISIIVGAVFVLPLVEEVSKAWGLWLFRGALRTHIDGLLLGLMAGLGFGFVESAGYILGGMGSAIIFLLIWFRVATMLMHGLTTGLIGAGYAQARLTGKRFALWSGLRRALIVHGGWNAGGILLIISGSACVSLITFVALCIAAGWVLPRSVRAAIDRAIQAEHAHAGAPLPGIWSPIENGVWWRLAGGQPEFPTR